jgi:hypothetical protein
MQMKTKFYHVTVDFLVEAEDKDSARKMVADHNFSKVLEHENGWHNFTVERVGKVKEEDVI